MQHGPYEHTHPPAMTLVGMCMLHVCRWVDRCILSCGFTCDHGEHWRLLHSLLQGIWAKLWTSPWKPASWSSGFRSAESVSIRLGLKREFYSTPNRPLENTVPGLSLPRSSGYPLEERIPSYFGKTSVCEIFMTLKLLSGSLYLPGLPRKPWNMGLSCDIFWALWKNFIMMRQSPPQPSTV